MFERSGATRLADVADRFRRTLSSVEKYYLSHRFQVNTLALISVSAFLVRYTALLGNPAPPGADYGNYLTNLHAAEGNDVTGGGVQYPFVFIGYLWIVESVFGGLQGLIVSGPLLAALVSVPSYLLLRNFAKPFFALVGTGILTFGDWASEMIGWGGNPNLLGILFGTCFMAFLAQYLRTGKRRDLVLSAVSLALTAGSHQISVVVFGVAALLAIVIARALKPEGDAIARGSRVLTAGLAFSLPFVPFYLGFASTAPVATLAAPTPITLHDILAIFDWFFRDSLIIWIPLTALALVGYRRMLASDPTSFAVGISLVVSPLLLMMTLMSEHPVRPVYFLPFGVVPGTVAFLQTTADQVRATPEGHPPAQAKPAIMLAVALAVALAVVPSSQARMAQAAAFYTVATPDLLDALHWIGDNTPRSALVATSGPSQYGQEATVGCDWGWWIEGYAERESLCTEDVQNLAWASQVTRSVEANHAFAGVVSFENGWVRVGEFAPYGTRGTPMISGDFGMGYEPLVFFDDAAVIVTWKEAGTHAVRTENAHDLGVQTSLDRSNGSVTLQSAATGPGISILRKVTLAPRSAVTWNNYTVEVAGNLSQVSVSVFGTSSSQLNNFDAQTATLSVGSAPGFQENAAGSVQIRDGAGELTSVDAQTNPEASLPKMGFTFGPAGSWFNLSFAVTAFASRSVSASGVQVYEARQVLAAAGAGYVLVDKTRIRDYEWIAADTAGFRMAYQNAQVALFSVVG